jgi:Fe-S-cluster containining protein
MRQPHRVLRTAARHGLRKAARRAVSLAPRCGYKATMTLATPSTDSELCQACGACCSYSSNWPRFSTEEDEALDLIPQGYVNERQSGMRCDGERCSALTGIVGQHTSCAIYQLRPEVCRSCLPGDPECAMARRRFKLAPLPA